MARTPDGGTEAVMRRVALVACLSFVFAACGGEGSVLGGPGTTSTSSTTTGAPGTTLGGGSDQFPPLVAEAYLDGCAGGASDLAYCRCTLQEFEERLTLDEFLALEDLSGGVVLEVANICLGEVGGGDPLTATTLDTPQLPPDNLRAYIHGFSPEAGDILDKFDFATQITRLDKSNLLYLVVSKFAELDLHVDRVSNLEMGRLYEEAMGRPDAARVSIDVAADDRYAGVGGYMHMVARVHRDWLSAR